MIAKLVCVIDKDGHYEEVLHEEPNLEKLDEYMQRFENSDDVRKVFSIQIKEFLGKMKWYFDSLEARNYELGKKTKKNEGRISIYCEQKDKNTGEIRRRYFPVLYNDERLKKRKPNLKIGQKLKDPKVFERLITDYRYLLDSKYFKSDYVDHTIALYKRLKFDKYKDEIVRMIVDKLMDKETDGPKMDERTKYYFYRTLVAICKDLLVIKTKRGTVTANKKQVDGKLTKDNQYTGKNIYDHELDEYYNQVVDLLNWKQIYCIDKEEGRKR